MTVHADIGRDVDLLRWELIADPDDPEAGIIMSFPSLDGAEALLSDTGYQSSDRLVSVPQIYERRTAMAYTHPASSQVILATRRPMLL